MAEPKVEKSKSISEHIKEMMMRKNPAMNAMSKAMEDAKKAKENQPASYETSRKK